MIIANDATVKAGAFFPMTTKKVLARAADRHGRIGCRWSTWSIRPACFCRCRKTSFPTRTTSAASFATTPCISAAGSSQIAAIMGNCVAGGGYLPVLCDKLLMTEGSGPVSGRAGAGEKRDRPGGSQRGTGRRADARRRSAARSTIREPDDDACLGRIRGWLSSAVRPTRTSPRRHSPGTQAQAARPTCGRRLRRGRVRIRARTTKSATCCDCIVDRRQLRRVQGRVRRRRWSAARRGSAAFPSASSPISITARSRPTAAISSAACCTSTAPTRPLASS